MSSYDNAWSLFSDNPVTNNSSDDPSPDKTNMIRNMHQQPNLNLDEIFPQGFNLTDVTNNAQVWQSLQSSLNPSVPTDPLLNSLVQASASTTIPNQPSANNNHSNSVNNPQNFLFMQQTDINQRIPWAVNGPTKNQQQQQSQAQTQSQTLSAGSGATAKLQQMRLQHQKNATAAKKTPNDSNKPKSARLSSSQTATVPSSAARNFSGPQKQGQLAPSHASKPTQQQQQQQQHLNHQQQLNRPFNGQFQFGTNPGGRLSPTPSGAVPPTLTSTTPITTATATDPGAAVGTSTSTPASTTGTVINPALASQNLALLQQKRDTLRTHQHTLSQQQVLCQQRILAAQGQGTPLAQNPKIQQQAKFLQQSKFMQQQLQQQLRQIEEQIRLISAVTNNESKKTEPDDLSNLDSILGLCNAAAQRSAPSKSQAEVASSVIQSDQKVASPASGLMQKQQPSNFNAKQGPQTAPGPGSACGGVKKPSKSPVRTLKMSKVDSPALDSQNAKDFSNIIIPGQNQMATKINSQDEFQPAAPAQVNQLQGPQPSSASPEPSQQGQIPLLPSSHPQRSMQTLSVPPTGPSAIPTGLTQPPAQPAPPPGPGPDLEDLYVPGIPKLTEMEIRVKSRFSKLKEIEATLLNQAQEARESDKKKRRLEGAPPRDQNRALNPNWRSKFEGNIDLWQRLIPYHIYSDLESDVPENEWQDKVNTVVKNYASVFVDIENRFHKTLSKIYGGSSLSAQPIEHRPSVFDEILLTQLTFTLDN